MKAVLLAILFVSFSNCAQDKRPIIGDTEYQRDVNSKFKDATTSPLKDKDRKNFKGLNFFKFDSLYVVQMKLTRTPDEKPFKMKTTTSRLPNYLKFGVVEFELKGAQYKLNIYQNLDIIDQEEYEDYLFLPFLDDTNGDESYGGGRYVEGSIPKGDTLVINFNEAYNPYCAYNEKYSCPIVPRENYVSTRIEAGVKAFDKH